MKLLPMTAVTLAILLYSATGVCGELSTSQSIEINASPEQVWKLLVDVDKWAEWNPAVKKAELKNGDGEKPGSVIDFHPIIGGKPAPKVKLKLEKSDKPRVLEFTSKAPGMDIVFGFSVVEKDGVTVVASYETIGGPGAAAFKAMYGQDGLDREHREWVEAIKKELETSD